MRKIAVLLVAAVLGFSAVGCGGGDAKKPDMTPAKPEEKKADAAAPAPAEPKKDDAAKK